MLLIIIDGWTPRLLGPALERGELPVLGELASRGVLALDALSIFPSITPAATASIMTGEYPAAHGIAGMSWWNASTDEVSYFGDDVRTVLRRGAGDFVRDFLLRLNGDRLQAPTIFQLVERNGRRAACFNHLIFRGDVAHEVSPPWLLQWLPGVNEQLTIQGPSTLCLGDLVSTSPRRALDAPGGVFNRFGLDDAGTEAFLRDVPSASALPDFSVAYFADYDFDSHNDGPQEAMATLKRLDRRLGAIFDHWGGLDQVLDDTAIVMTADHGHSVIGGNGEAALDLDPLLSGYRRGNPATGWRDGDELLVCPNMRSAEVFHRFDGDGRVRQLAADMLRDDRVDQVTWRDALEDGRDRFHVMTADRGSLSFQQAASGAPAVVDEYGGSWKLSGDAKALDLAVDGDSVRFGIYPNALERIANGIAYPNLGRLWVTARPGYEFAMAGQSVHTGAGSHGTLHDHDSRVPLLIAGGSNARPFTGTPRIVDVVPICAEMLKISFHWAPGDPRR